MIIFLDIDGVILPVGAMRDADVTEIFKDPWAWLDRLVAATPPDGVLHVKQLLAHHDGKLVVHSSWRRFFPLDFTRAYLERVGLGEHLHADDWYCSMRFSSHKAHDIGMWLDEHPEVKSVIVIDDDDVLCDHKLKATVIKPIPSLGLTADDIRPYLTQENAPCVA